MVARWARSPSSARRPASSSRERADRRRGARRLPVRGDASAPRASRDGSCSRARSRFAPYERPALSKELLAGRREAESVALRPADFWQEKGIELLLGTRIERIAGRTAVTADGQLLGWDALVIATGAIPRQLEPAGRDLQLRTLADALALREELRPGARLTIVGVRADRHGGRLDRSGPRRRRHSRR